MRKLAVLLVVALLASCTPEEPRIENCECDLKVIVSEDVINRFGETVRVRYEIIEETDINDCAMNGQIMENTEFRVSTVKCDLTTRN